MPAHRSFLIGFCWAFPEAEPEEALRRLRGFGYDGIELWPDALRQWGADRWASALSAAGMGALQLCPYFDFMKGEPGIVKSRAMLEEFIAAARRLDCRKLRVFTGPPWGEGVVGAKEATGQQWSDAIGSLREFCDIAARDGIELCLECHEGSLMENSPSALRLLRGVGRPNLTTNLQIPFVDEPWTESLAALARFTTHVHIHNWTLGLGEGDLTFLGEGKFDWEPVVRTLLAEGPGHLVLSVEHANHNGRHDPWETAARDGVWLRQLRERLASA